MTRFFSTLRCHLEPDYHQLEFGGHVYLTRLDAGDARLCSARHLFYLGDALGSHGL